MTNSDIDKLREAVRTYAEAFDKVEAVLPEGLSESQLYNLKAKFEQLRTKAERL